MAAPSRFILMLGGAVLLGAPFAGAQVPLRPAVVHGRVIDAQSRKPLQYTLVDIVDQGRRVETDADGRFRIEGLQPQLVTVRMRQIGYPVTERALNLFAGRESLVEYALVRPPPTLAEVRVTARGPRVPANVLMGGFEDRMRLGIGTFFDQAQLDRYHNRQVTDLLREASGIRVVEGPRGEMLVASNRMLVGSGAGRGSGACFLQVVVDGMVVWSPESQRGGMAGLGPPDLNYLVPVSDLAGVEVYSGIAGVPAQYRREGNTCGVILFWSRRGDAVPVLR